MQRVGRGQDDPIGQAMGEQFAEGPVVRYAEARGVRRAGRRRIDDTCRRAFARVPDQFEVAAADGAGTGDGDPQRSALRWLIHAFVSLR
jgi:hypothetical protein